MPVVLGLEGNTSIVLAIVVALSKSILNFSSLLMPFKTDTRCLASSWAFIKSHDFDWSRTDRGRV